MDGEERLHGFRLITLETVGSTNDEAASRARDGAGEGTLVRARRQEAGRGRLGRTWVSAAGNLYFSLILRPACPIAEAGQIGFVAANAVADAVAEMLPERVDVTCKWPNDVLADGRKVAGMLLESEIRPDGGLDWLIVGIGVNVASHPEDVRYPATSLRACGADEGLSPDDVLDAFCRHFRDGYAGWRQAGFETVRREWLRRAAGRGLDLRATTIGATIDGIFEDLDADGALVLRRPDGGRTRVTAGDVHFAATPS